MNLEIKTDLSVANEINRQLGGAMVMLGAHSILGYSRSLLFAIRGCQIINKIRVTLESSDTYTVTFYKVARRGLDFATVAVREMVYADNLKSVISSETGLATSL